tara:strand:- start:6 stop:437 length:432 start_codon:yes stop_codon:yes gene_type:complete
MASNLGPIENNPKLFIELWADMTWKARQAKPGKYRGIRIWAHTIRDKVLAEGYTWENKAGEELTGGKLTRFLTRMRKAMELNLQRFEDLTADEAFARINGSGDIADWKEDPSRRPYFEKIEEVTELVDEGTWGSWFAGLKPRK